MICDSHFVYQILCSRKLAICFLQELDWLDLCVHSQKLSNSFIIEPFDMSLCPGERFNWSLCPGETNWSLCPGERLPGPSVQGRYQLIHCCWHNYFSWMPSIQVLYISTECVKLHVAANELKTQKLNFLVSLQLFITSIKLEN